MHVMDLLRCWLSGDATPKVAVDGSVAIPEPLEIESDQLPATLGQKAKTASFPVTLASDEDTIGVNATVVVPTAPYHGVVTVASAGTAVALSDTAQALAAGVQVRAHIGNTGLIYVGGDTVAAANGYRLAQGESVFLSIADLADVYVDAAEDGDAVSFLAS